MALEVIREIVGGFAGDDRGLVGRLLLVDCARCASRRSAMPGTRIIR